MQKNTALVEYQLISLASLVDVITRKMMSFAIKLDCPSHISALLKSPIKSFWLDSIFKNYDKMDCTGILSTLIFNSEIPSDVKNNMVIYNPVLSFKIKPIDISEVYELYTRTCADGSLKANTGLKFNLNFTYVVDTLSLQFLKAITASKIYDWFCSAY